MNEIKNVLGNIKTRFMSLGKATRVLIVVILAVMVVGLGAAEMLVGDDGPGFGGEGNGINQNGGHDNQDAEGDNGGDGGFGKEGATRSLSSSFFQLGIILTGIIVIALVLKPKKITVIKQHVLGVDDEEIDND